MAVGGVKALPWSILHCTSLIASLVYCWVAPSAFAEDFPEFIEQPQSQPVPHSYTVALRCAANPSDAQIRWLFNGGPLDERWHNGLQVVGSNLHFMHAHAGDGEDSNLGEYRCTATTSQGTVISQPAVLSRAAIGHFQATDDVNIVVPEGGYATLTCNAPESNPAPYVVFQKANGELVDTSKDTVHRLPSGNLVLTNVTSASAGDFRCVAVNPVSGLNRTSPSRISLRVEKAVIGSPSFSHIMLGMKRKVEVALGHSVTLECPSFGHPVANITWSKFGGSLPLGRYFVTEFGNLRIEPTLREDVGTYRCSSQGGGSGEGQVYLEVFTPSSIQVTMEQVMAVGAGKRVELVCSVRGHPKPDLQWYHNGRELPSRSGGSLVLPQVTSADSGIYQCIASNSVGIASRAVRLEVGGQLDGPSLPDLLSRKGDGEDSISGNEKSQDQRRKSGRRDRKKHGRKNVRMRDKRKKKKNGPVGLAGKEKPKYAPSVPAVTQLSDRSVMLNWTVPDKGNGQTIKFFKVQFKEMSPQKGPWQTNDAILQANERRFEVANLKSGGSYKFRILAVYEDDDNKNSANTPIFKLVVQPHAQAQSPDMPPTIVEAKPIVYKENFGIGVKWQYKAELASPIEGFIILYRPYTETVDKEWILPGAGIRNHVISNLLPSTAYNIRMQTFNMAGRSDISNQVVATTKARDPSSFEGYPPDLEPPPLEPKKTTEEPVSGRRSSETLEQPVILGIVLGALLLALFILVTMCWWKQRQQKRRNLASGSQQKFQDQSQCIFADNTTHNKSNGSFYPANGSLPIANGHGPPHDGHNRMNIDVNPLAEYDMQTSVHGESRPKQIHGNGVNGIVPRFGLENCNNNSCPHGGTTHIGCNGGDLPYMEQLPKQPLYPMQHRTLPQTPHAPLSSFYSEAGSLTRSLNHEYSEPGDMEIIPQPGLPSLMFKQSQIQPRDNMGQPTMMGPGPLRTFDYSWPSGSYDQARPEKSHISSRERLSPAVYPAPIDFATSSSGRGLPRHKHMLPTAPTPPPPPPCVPGLNFGTIPGSLGPGPMSVNPHGKHRRRRKRAHSHDHQQMSRDLAVKDQATNTDLSSNEGTLDFTTFCTSGSGSSSNSGSEAGDGRDCNSSFANNGSLESIDDSQSAMSVTSHEAEFRYSATLPVPL